MKLLVIIPCYNEEKTIADVVTAIPKKIPGIKKIDVLVIDDGSSDRSAAFAAKAGAAVLSHQQNRGVGAAFNSGLDYALSRKYDIMVNIDADRQFNPADIPDLARPILNNEADFVSASRFIDPTVSPKNMSKVKLWGNKMMSLLISRLCRKKFHDVSCGFRAYSRECMLRINLQGKFTYTQETFLDVAFKELRIKEVPVRVKYYSDRKSKIASSIIYYAVQTSSIIFRTYRDYYPLRFFWSISAVTGLIGLCLFSFFIGWYIYAGKFSPHIWSGFVSGSFLVFLLYSF
ncbi:MAG TPA: glycosyltransferase family 2 protein [Spirochaetota bacterium]|nr:glycosyltransferase family 2 protein [Spirochaetota bacterium]HPR49936.1 glycosyltransferase family 2 protein [Spirochaetota bacterium]